MSLKINCDEAIGFIAESISKTAFLRHFGFSSECSDPRLLAALGDQALELRNQTPARAPESIEFLAAEELEEFVVTRDSPPRKTFMKCIHLCRCHACEFCILAAEHETEGGCNL